MKIVFRDVKEESSFIRIADLYKKSFPKEERIKAKSFHQYAHQDGISFKSIYLNDKFIGFYKGFIDSKTLYISCIALRDDSYWKEVILAIKEEFSGRNLVFALRKEEETSKYEELGFKRPKLGKTLQGSNLLFVCSKPEFFKDEEIANKIKNHDWPLMFDASSPSYIYYAKVDDLDVEKEMRNLPNIRQEMAKAFKFEKDKKLSVGAYLLLAKAMKLHHVDIAKYEFKYEENGKPYLKDCPIKFSISHSGDYVAVALSKKSVGLDIQRMDEIKANLAKVVFNQLDMDFYEESPDKKPAFYTIWTYKEAFIKMTGEGLKKPLKDICINYLFSFNGAFFYNFDLIEDYQLTVASETYGVRGPRELKI